MNKFANLSTARQLTDEEMLELRGGAAQACNQSCKPGCSAGCKTACQPGNQNGTGSTVIIDLL